MTEDGLAVDAKMTPPLRGLVDIFEGATHLYQALIVASERDGGLMRYKFKRNAPALRAAPPDFELSHPQPAGLLPES